LQDNSRPAREHRSKDSRELKRPNTKVKILVVGTLSSTMQIQTLGYWPYIVKDLVEHWWLYIHSLSFLPYSWEIWILIYFLLIKWNETKYSPDFSLEFEKHCQFMHLYRCAFGGNVRLFERISSNCGPMRPRCRT